MCGSMFFALSEGFENPPPIVGQEKEQNAVSYIRDI